MKYRIDQKFFSRKKHSPDSSISFIRHQKINEKIRNFFSLKLTTPKDGDILIDYSKNRIDEEGLKLFFQLCKDRKLLEARQCIMKGAKVNFTEGRQVLHSALRNRDPENNPIIVEGKDIMPDIKDVLNHMKEFSEQVISGDWKG